MGGEVNLAKGRHGRSDGAGVATGYPAGQLKGKGKAEYPHRHSHRHRVAGLQTLLQSLPQLLCASVVVVPQAEPQPHALGHGEQV